MYIGTGNVTLYPQAFHQLPSEEIKLLGWNIPAEALHMVHPHWRGFRAPPFYMHLIVALIYFFLMIASFLGNGIVIYIFTTSKILRTPSNMLIVNLAVFDFLMMTEMPLLLGNSWAERMLGYEIGCNIYAGVGSVSGIGASITNAMIALDRYKTISSPMSGRLNYTQTGLLIGFTWLWTMPFTLLPWLQIWGRYIPEGFLTACSFDYLSDDEDNKVFVATIFIWAYVIPLTMITTFYTKLFIYVRNHEKLLKEQAKKMNVKSLQANQTSSSQNVELRIAKAAFTIFFLFICGWTPYAIVTMTGTFGDKRLLTPTVAMIPAVACKAASCIDPWIYAISHPKYRIELEKRMPWLGIREKSNIDSDTKSAATSCATEK